MLFSVGVCVKMGYGAEYTFSGISSRDKCYDLFCTLWVSATQARAKRDNTNMANWKRISTNLSLHGGSAFALDTLSVTLSSGTPTASINTSPDSPSNASTSSPPPENLPATEPLPATEDVPPTKSLPPPESLPPPTLVP
mmetsp:Transcript_11948/g.19295  ORF Transcript_11948/g.19295 Transcript_11948/m.19295 type:complete len:139 (+) Transcript_11948:458-874(+)